VTAPAPRKETDEKPYAFELDWEFKSEATMYNFPGSPDLGFAPGGAVFLSEIDRVRRRVGDVAAEALREKLNIPPVTEPVPQKSQSATSGNGPPVPTDRQSRSAVDLSDNITGDERKQRMDALFEEPPQPRKK